MYTEEDIENLAEFLFLAFYQSLWQNNNCYPVPEWRTAYNEAKDAWRASAKVALEFKLTH